MKNDNGRTDPLETKNVNGNIRRISIFATITMAIITAGSALLSSSRNYTELQIYQKINTGNNIEQDAKILTNARRIDAVVKKLAVDSLNIYQIQELLKEIKVELREFRKKFNDDIIKRHK